jgi:hypothetical protein
MERTVLTFSVANLITVNLMVFLLLGIIMLVGGVIRGRSDNG